MNVLGNVVGSIVRGGIIKAGAKKLVKGIKTGAGKIVKGLKRQVNRGKRFGKQLTAEVKSIPTGVGRIKQMIKIYPDAWAKKTPYEKVTAMLDRVNKVRFDAGKKALKKAKQEDLVRLLQKTGTTVKAKKSLQQILKNARKDETWGQMTSRLTGEAKKLFGGVAKGGMENVAIDQTLQILGKGALGLGSGVVAGVTTAKVMEKK
jgi:hypothetical protein